MTSLPYYARKSIETLTAPQRRPVMGWSIVFMFSISLLVGATATLLLYVFHFIGVDIRIRRIRLHSLENIWYSTTERFCSIAKLAITFHLPRPDNPYWAIMSTEDFEYKDSRTHVTIRCCEVKFWVFPVLFRFTAGPWIVVRLDGFIVHVNSSWNSPWWIVAIRDNLVTTVVHGETIRLNHSDTKVYLNAFTRPQIDEESKNEETTGTKEVQPNDELRLRSSLSQWHLLASWHARMYSFDDLQVEIRRNWAEDRGSFVMIAKGCRWTKVPAIGKLEEYRRASMPWQIFHAFYSLPYYLINMCRDPLSVVDIYAPRTDMTFGNFRLRDAELFHQGAVKLKEEYCKLETRHPGIVEDLVWDMFVHGVLSSFQD